MSSSYPLTLLYDAGAACAASARESKDATTRSL